MASIFGSQTPTFQKIGRYNPKHGKLANYLFTQIGVELRASQKLEMELFASRNADGTTPTARAIAISRPRQNGKTFAVFHYAIWAAFIESKKVLFTFHNASRARETFEQAVGVIESTQFLGDRLLPRKGIYRAQGNEGIYLKNGGEIRFTTRTNSGARGGSVHLLIYDEAQELTDDEQAAILPTLSASEGRGQAIYVGTPPGASTLGTVFRRLHDLAHDPTQELSTWWLEWAVEDFSEEMNRDTKRWQATNPLLGYRITLDTVQTELESMLPDTFARERLGWWPPSGTADLAPIFTADQWASVETLEAPKSEPRQIWLGVKFSLDGGRVSVAIAQDNQESIFLEIAKNASTARGTKWLSRWILENRTHVRAVAIDGKRGDPVASQLLEGRFPKKRLKKTTTLDMAKATAALVDAVEEGNIQIYAQPDLHAAACGCPRRKIGQDGLGFQDTEKYDSTLPEALALALWARQTNPPRATGISI